MHLGNFKDMDDAYPWLVDAVKATGFWCDPRGKICQELRPASFCILEPARGLYHGAERKLNYRFWALETLMYISGTDDRVYHRLLTQVNRNMLQFINTETGTFDGAYGPRLKASLATCYALLKADPWTRQAVASVWNNSESRLSLDVPCTLSMQFFCTPSTEDDGQFELNLHVLMRSNDLNWGTPYDVAAFCEILCLMAGVLGLKVGRYYHVAGSLHIYRDSPPSVRKPHEPLDPLYTYGRNLFDAFHMPSDAKIWDDVVNAAHKILEHAYSESNYNRGDWRDFKITGDDIWVRHMQTLIRTSSQLCGQVK